MINLVEQREKLTSECNKYLSYLRESIKKEMKKTNSVHYNYYFNAHNFRNHDQGIEGFVSNYAHLDLHKTDELTLAVHKYNAVNNMREALEEGLESFKSKFRKNRELLETRRDTAGMIFLKGVLTLCTGFIAAACGLWAVKGKDMSKKIDNIIKAGLAP